MATPKKQVLSEVQALSTAMPKYCANMTFVLGGTTYTAPSAVQIAAALLAADNATVQAKAAYKEALTAEKKLFAISVPVIRELRQNLELVFSNSPPTLADLQIALRKTPTPLTAQARAAKAAKAKATRLARGTTSKKQKATVSGNVSGVTITPVVIGAAPAAPAPVPVTTAAPQGATAATAH